MTTFTASEVVAKLRERFASGNDVPVPDVRLTRAEFDVIADRLEADEKAVPVTWVNPDDLHNPNFVGINAVKIGHEGLGKHYTLPLYTHPDPADAERLAEVLEIIDGWMEIYDHQGTGSSRDASRSEKEWTVDRAKLVALLTIHSAQAQPPAASVPDAMQELADKYHELLLAVARKFPGETRHETALRYIREAECQEAALAAQENPNG